MPQKWKKIKSDIVFDHKWFRLRQDTVQLPNGHVIDDYIVSERPDVALVFPVTAEGLVVMVEQYKHAAREILLEFPGGFFDAASETPEDAAKRELCEETGYTSKNLIPLGLFYDNPTKDCNRTYLFIATGCTLNHAPQPDDTEDITVHLFPQDEVEGMILNNHIRATLSVALGLLALKNLKEQ